MFNSSTIYALFTLQLLLLSFCSVVNAINIQSIRLALEPRVKRARDYVELNYEEMINSVEYDGFICSNPPAWDSPLCNGTETLIGVRPNNHDPDTGDILRDNTCTKYNENIGCGWDNIH